MSCLPQRLVLPKNREDELKIRRLSVPSGSDKTHGIRNLKMCFIIILSFRLILLSLVGYNSKILYHNNFAPMRESRLVFLFTLFILLASCVTKSDKTDLTVNYSEKLGQTPVVLAYVTAWSDVVPDPKDVTHINYAFGHVSDSFDGVRIDNEDRLKTIASLKKDYPMLKVLLSIGGWGSGRFSEMAADNEYRTAFAKDCKRIVDQFDLDGIDLDWEYPTSSAAKISSSLADTENFTLLMRDIRKEIGEEKLLTLASYYLAYYIDFKAIDQYTDFVNIMTYDMGRPPCHNAPLYKSEHTFRISADESVDAHVAAGVPLNKLTLGLPFYGHGIDGVSDFIDYKDIVSLDGYTSKWDSLAQVPYLVDKKGNYVCSYDDEKSLKIKCEYLLKKGMLGAMYWDYSGDDAKGTLRKIVYNTVMQK